jgi:hypothetical protein
MKAGLVGWLQTTPHLDRYGRFVGSVGELSRAWVGEAII